MSSHSDNHRSQFQSPPSQDHFPTVSPLTLNIDMGSQQPQPINPQSTSSGAPILSVATTTGSHNPPTNFNATRGETHGALNNDTSSLPTPTATSPQLAGQLTASPISITPPPLLASSVPGGGLIAATTNPHATQNQYTPRSASIISHSENAPTSTEVHGQQRPGSSGQSVQFLPTTNLGTNTRSRTPSHGQNSDVSNNTLVGGTGGGNGGGIGVGTVVNDVPRPTRRISRGGVSMYGSENALPPLPPTPPLEAVLADGASISGRMPPTRARSMGGTIATRRSGLDWIVPGVEEKPRPRTVGERLKPTIDHADAERMKYATKAKLTGWALNVAIGLQVLLGALTTGLSAVTTGRQTSIMTAILGGLSTVVASYLARARGSNEPELSITRVKDLEQFLRECEAFRMDYGHVIGNEHDATLDNLRNHFEGLLGNANGERKFATPV